jgi:hypothetical protein
MKRKKNPKEVQRYAAMDLLVWFPKIHSYQAFNARLNRLSEALKLLVSELVDDFIPEGCSQEIHLLDSFPIITCSGKRRGQVAQEVTNKGYCSTKNLWYYGVKLHALNRYNKGTLPHPESLILSPASEHDLNVFKENWSELKHCIFFGDKIYHDEPFFKNLYHRNYSIMYTPIKEIKGKSETLKYHDYAYESLFSKAVSRIRQPIESFFNWINEKTGLQNASKVRSLNGLMVHIYGKLAVCFLKPIFNP